MLTLYFAIFKNFAVFKYWCQQCCVWLYVWSLWFSTCKIMSLASKNNFTSSTRVCVCEFISSIFITVLNRSVGYRVYYFWFDRSLQWTTLNILRHWVSFFGFYSVWVVTMNFVECFHHATLLIFITCFPFYWCFV